MEVKIITCHDVYNYGASLQAFALQSFLASLGHEVFIIDYIPEYLKTSYSFWNLPFGDDNDKFRNNIIFHFLLSVKLFPQRFSTWRRIKPFKSFKKKYIRCTSKYRNYDELENNPPSADIYIAGSDQIWNIYLHNGLDPAFYLSFGNSKAKRIAYAASFAMPFVPADYIDFVKKHLLVFDAISVRESTGLDILNSLSLNGVLVSDPVFLLSREQWLERLSIQNSLSDEYVIVYCLNPEKKTCFDFARQISDNIKKPVVVIEGIKPVHCDWTVVRNAGPKEFVSLFSKAAYVVSDSFHGTAFSLIFGKPFMIFHHHSDVSRINDLLNVLELQKCLNPSMPVHDFNWERIHKKISSLVESSKFFLMQNLRM